jgi:hypothetical protein
LKKEEQKKSPNPNELEFRKEIGLITNSKKSGNSFFKENVLINEVLFPREINLNHSSIIIDSFSSTDNTATAIKSFSERLLLLARICFDPNLSKIQNDIHMGESPQVHFHDQCQRMFTILAMRVRNFFYIFNLLLSTI